MWVHRYLASRASSTTLPSFRQCTCTCPSSELVWRSQPQARSAISSYALEAGSARLLPSCQCLHACPKGALIHYPCACILTFLLYFSARTHAERNRCRSRIDAALSNRSRTKLRAEVNNSRSVYSPSDTFTYQAVVHNGSRRRQLYLCLHVHTGKATNEQLIHVH